MDILQIKSPDRMSGHQSAITTPTEKVKRGIMRDKSKAQNKTAERMKEREDKTRNKKGQKPFGFDLYAQL